MHYLTWDIGAVAGLAILLAYSLIIRKHKALATLVSVYVGYVMAGLWGPRVYAFFNGEQVLPNQVWIKANASLFVIEALLMVLITFVLSSCIKLGGRRARYTMPEVTIYAVATMALGLVFLLSFMSPEMRDQIIAGSKILPWVYKFRELIQIVPLAVIIFFGLYGNEDV